MNMNKDVVFTDLDEGESFPTERHLRSSYSRHVTSSGGKTDINNALRLSLIHPNMSSPLIHMERPDCYLPVG